MLITKFDLIFLPVKYLSNILSDIKKVKICFMRKTK